MNNIVYLVEPAYNRHKSLLEIDLNKEFYYLKDARKYAKKISKQYKCEVYLSYIGRETYFNGKKE